MDGDGSTCEKLAVLSQENLEENGSNCGQPFGHVGRNNTTRCQRQLISKQCENHIPGLAQMSISVFLWFAANLIS